MAAAAPDWAVSRLAAADLAGSAGPSQGWDTVAGLIPGFLVCPQIEDETQVSRATQGEQDNYEMHVRAANIVRAGESLMKLVSDLKQFLILNDFPSVNEAIDQRNQQLRALQEECDRKLITLRDEISIDLYELEEEYYSSSSSLCEANDLPLCEAYGRLDLDTDSADGLSAPLLASPEPSAGPLQAAAPAHSHAGGPGPTEHA
ncbi:mediator of RNA polymerase II transcription subunit 22-like [Sapajus apella]|uniref:Mediator of RNA polymerase II transcription subunit 22 n=1 Tax=Sapajus apella TaxID=9515 RepID=A0A6J3HF75_SAPAP|nr:mediator of RNA polymerase II transcription subunit 22-like [Sapajus apella]